MTTPQTRTNSIDTRKYKVQTVDAAAAAAGEANTEEGAEEEEEEEEELERTDFCTHS